MENNADIDISIICKLELIESKILYGERKNAKTFWGFLKNLGLNGQLYQDKWQDGTHFI